MTSWCARGNVVVLRGQWPQRLELAMHRRQVAFLKCDEVLPAVVVTPVERGAAREEAIQEQAERQTREALLQAVGQPAKSLEFTVLLSGVFARVQ